MIKLNLKTNVLICLISSLFFKIYNIAQIKSTHTKISPCQSIGGNFFGEKASSLKSWLISAKESEVKCLIR